VQSAGRAMDGTLERGLHGERLRAGCWEGGRQAEESEGAGEAGRRGEEEGGERRLPTLMRWSTHEADRLCVRGSWLVSIFTLLITMFGFLYKLPHMIQSVYKVPTPPTGWRECDRSPPSHADRPSWRRSGSTGSRPTTSTEHDSAPDSVSPRLRKRPCSVAPSSMRRAVHRSLASRGRQ
jgi:hypothetical protein